MVGKITRGIERVRRYVALSSKVSGVSNTGRDMVVCWTRRATRYNSERRIHQEGEEIETGRKHPMMTRCTVRLLC